MEEVRVRFAPSPTGYLHVGGARTALFNYYFAKKNNGKFILRIEDTDQKRLKEDSISQILSSMKWLGMDWDEGPEIGGEYGPYFQSERIELYRREIKRLLDEGKAYYCFCTEEDIEKEREEQRKNKLPYRYSGRCSHLSKEEIESNLKAGKSYVIRIKMPRDGSTEMEDLIRGKVVVDNGQLDDYIIMKSNGIPTYNFACVIDDHAMRISHVIRAEEHLSNTPKQILTYRALDYEVPKFAHLPMILAPDRSKLSKRHGATSVEEFREDGYLPETLVNYLTLLGWSPGGNEELFSIEETIERFSLAKVNKTAAIYDIKKLSWMNGQYLTKSDLEYITKEAIPYLIEDGLIESNDVEERYDYIKRVVNVVREKVKLLTEIPEASSYFFKDIDQYEEKGVKKRFKKEGVTEILEKGKEALKNASSFDVETVEKVYRDLIDELGIKGGDIIHPTRLAISGRTVGPSLFDIISILGKETCVERMDKAISYINKNILE
ncbi:glutamate--tRNA ligase [Anaerosalibacter bizertensis]|uniref:Glutamate--tRNA ligase n=1 Tax=Anaerosalibacter bizertensis TaxID=932217 RepID=A0A9Q4FM40_9FIRM|nr:glutamate--tRNA ligase [Anaerosalibacter bizertensis]MCB5558972.1 glutamate--tRNA ligase [Anaerosalibacter bizertensis]MCG4565270.1 glutamate--tRNA ligase [Anaerosalibacter bizertensis]